MQYINRTIERQFLHMSAAFKAIMLVGARQVGKSTVLKHLAKNNERTYVSMDDIRVRSIAKDDPYSFFQVYKPPILIDEVQKAPEIFEPMKILCDNSEEKGLFWLTGSQSSKLLSTAGDSLAGRLVILKLYSLSTKEILGLSDLTTPDFSIDGFLARDKFFPLEAKDLNAVYERIWLGGMPELRTFDDWQQDVYWNSYIENYLMRDAVDDFGIKQTEKFRKFLRGCAAFTSRLVNCNDLAQVAGISGATAKNWLKVLEAMGIIFLLEPFYANELKRLVKTPKLYFCDTGLATYLSYWTSRDTLMHGAAAGYFFENYVIGEMLRNTAYAPEKWQLNFYRDSNKKEIDLIIEEDGVLHPFELKRHSMPDKKIINNFKVLDSYDKTIGSGGIICQIEYPLPINTKNFFIPATIL